MVLDYAIRIELEKPIKHHPPLQPTAKASILETSLWALKLRWWAWQNQPSEYHNTQIRLYVMYQSPTEGVALPHSTGIQNGLIGLIHARANGTGRRIHNVIIAHELMHILGATDKYDLLTGEPVFPDGYAKPNKHPTYPQNKAELMGRSIPISSDKHKVAVRLGQTEIGSRTANEIGWGTDNPTNM